MMNRRWFFTATGSAFLTAACTVVRQNDSAIHTPLPLPATPDEHFESLLIKFFIGLDDQIKAMQALPESELSEHQLPRARPELERRFRPTLTAIYRKRFDHRLEKDELPDKLYPLRLHQACVLGQLTGLAFAYESGALKDPDFHSFEKPDEHPVLGVKHLEWARDTFGFYTNSKIAKRRPIDLCGEKGGPRAQIDDPCPFCHA